MFKLAIENATDQQLRAFCETTLQLELTGINDRARVEALMRTAWPNDFILVESEPVGHSEQIEPVTPKPDMVFDTGRDDGPPVSLKILTTDMPGGKHPAHPDVNGKMIVIQRNMLVTIPYAFYHAMLNAQVAVMNQEPDRDGKPGELVPTQVTNYPMSEVTLPPKHEIDAWRERNGSRLLAA